MRFVSESGQVRYRLGERLVDRYLEFVAGRCRPNTLRAVAFDLKSFFMVTGKDPVEVTAADVFDFLAHQRGDHSVIRLADRESGLSARTIARRLSSVSGLYAYLVARGDTPVRVNPVPRGLPLSAEGLDEILAGARRRAGLEHATCHELRHTCLTRLREAGMALEAVQAQAGHLSIESTRVYLHLANDWLATEYRRAAELIDADTGAVAEMLAVQQAAVR